MGFNQQLLVTALKAKGKSIYLPFTLHFFDSVPSTNQMVWDLLKQGCPSGSVVIAHQQTAGRGQWGRTWVSPPGGLYLSVGVLRELEAPDAYQLTLASAWGIASRLRRCGLGVGIKWPNDLVLNGLKLGGILTETKVNQGKITQFVIGVGINWCNSVPSTGINIESWQVAQNTQYIADMERLACEVLLGIESGIQYIEEFGVDVLLGEYLQVLVNIGDRVQINNDLGTVVGVTSRGNLHVCLNTDKPGENYVDVEPGTISLGYHQFD